MGDMFVPSRRTFLKVGTAACVATTISGRTLAKGPADASFVDSAGVWRWRDGREVALFGANYNLASASAFRFAKQSGWSFERIIETDFAHFKRMGFDGLRLCFWGDWEATRSTGDLIENEHLGVLDLTIERAAKAGFGLLLSPIVTYSSFWPDALARPAGGFSSVFEKSELGTNGSAIAAQCRYLSQLMSRTNPLTGRRYADEPAIVAVEPINEPWHHSSDLDGSVRYINALSNAVKSAGFRGPVFYNVTQDMGIAPAIARANVEGSTFAWYPTGLQNGFAIEGNGLLLVDDYPQFDTPALRSKAKLVYEFDAADTLDSYYYPAMVREFRRGGAQFAAMFAYDPIVAAAANSEFNDHFLNLVYTPAKAISALIASHAMHHVARGQDFGSYPDNMRFGGFRVDDRENLSEFVGTDRFYHSNTTTTRPENPQKLNHLAGCGSSPLVDYEGTGAWFLDKLADGVWRLEVYPDAAVIDNAFEFRGPDRPAVLTVRRQRKMTIDLPDLGESFYLATPSGMEIARSEHGKIEVQPGLYRLSRSRSTITFDDGLYAPEPDTFDPVLLYEPPTSLPEGKPWTAILQIVSAEAPRSVVLHIRKGGGFEQFPMTAGRGFDFSAIVPASLITAGFVDHYVTWRDRSHKVVRPDVTDSVPGDWDFPKTGGFRIPIVATDDPLVLFDAERDGGRIVVPYSNYVAQPPRIVANAFGMAALEFDGGSLETSLHQDLPAQVGWNGPIDTQGRDISSFSRVIVDGRSITGEGGVTVILIERDGTAWGAPAEFSPAAYQAEIPLSAFVSVNAAMLPRDFPLSINPYFLRSSKQSQDWSGPRLAELQAVQMTLGKRFGSQSSTKVQISRISLSR